MKSFRRNMKFFAASLAACVLVATAAVAGARPEKANKRFLFDTLNKLVDGAGDTLNHVAHAVIDPLAGGLHVMVDEFNRLVHGRGTASQNPPVLIDFLHLDIP